MSKVLFVFILFTGVTARTQTSIETLSLEMKTCADLIQAINKLPHDQKTYKLRLPKGNYECEKPVLISRSHTYLVGAGEYETVLKVKHGLVIPLVIIGDIKVKPEETAKHGVQFYPVQKIEDVRIEGMTLSGNFDPYKKTADQECFDAENNVSKSCDGDGGKFIRNNALTIRHAENIRVSHVIAENAASGGIVVEKKSSKIFIEDFTGRRNFFDGFAGYETTESEFRNMTLVDNNYSGISIDFEFENNIFDRIYLLANGDDGIFSHSLGNNTFKNVVMAKNKNVGIYIDGVRHGDQLIEKTCDGNKFINVEDFYSGNASLKLNHLCRNTIIENFTAHQNDKEKCLSLWPKTTVKKVGRFLCDVKK